MKTVYPLDFEEFLWAKKKELLIEKIKESFHTDTPINDGLHQEALNLYFVNQYKPEYSIRISSKNFGFVNNIKSVPLYAVFCL